MKKMNEKLFLNAIKLKGEFFPSWDEIPDKVWNTILKDYFFKISDSFGFAEVLETKNLFPNGLEYFDDWDLREIGLVEFEKEIVCRFELNDNCKVKLLQYDFAIHEKGMNPPRTYLEYDIEHYYHEFDILYFFKGDELKGYYINHESMIGFVNNSSDLELLDTIDSEITKYIIESEELEKAFRNNKKASS
jgi:hypothetical protein